MRLFLISCLFGVAAGIVYDVFRILRILIYHNALITALEDLLFFILYSVFIMSFTLGAARGEFRFYYMFGNILGFLIYFFSVGNLVIGIFLRISSVFKKYIINPLISTIKKPFYKKKY